MLFIGPFLFSFHSAFRVPGTPSFLVLPFLYLKKPLLLHLGQLLMHTTHRSFLSGPFSLSPGHDLSLATRLVLLSMRAIVSSVVVVMDDITLNWRLRTSKFVRSAFSCPIAVSGVNAYRSIG